MMGIMIVYHSAIAMFFERCCRHSTYTWAPVNQVEKEDQNYSYKVSLSVTPLLLNVLLRVQDLGFFALRDPLVSGSTES